MFLVLLTFKNNSGFYLEYSRKVGYCIFLGIMFYLLPAMSPFMGREFRVDSYPTAPRSNLSSIETLSLVGAEQSHWYMTEEMHVQSKNNQTP